MGSDLLKLDQINYKLITPQTHKVLKRIVSIYPGRLRPSTNEMGLLDPSLRVMSWLRKLLSGGARPLGAVPRAPGQAADQEP